MNKREQAVKYHLDGYNCSQAVLGAFAEDLGLNHELAMQVASGFGGGVRCASICGAVSGGVMAMGLKHGQTVAEDQETKIRMYQLTTEFQKRFKEKHGTVICQALLQCDITTPEGMEKVKTEGLSRTLCDKFISDAVAILEEMLGV